MKKYISSLIAGTLFLMSSEKARADWWECGWKNWECFAPFLLPRNPDGNKQTYGVNGDSEKYHEWAASEGHLYGKDNVIKMRLRFDEESLRTLSQTSLSQPFALEIDISEANNGTRLAFNFVESSFPPEASAIQDTSASDWINPNKNAMGLLVRDTRAIQGGKDYYVYFHLKYQIPEEGIAVVPSLQISYNTHYMQLAGVAIQDSSLLLALKSPWNFFPLESENYGDVNNNKSVSWMVYPSSFGNNANLLPGMSWKGKTLGDARKDFMLALNSNFESEVLDVKQAIAGKRYDYVDKICLASNKTDGRVEQFRNSATGRITIYNTPSDQTGYRYANADCGIEGFNLPATDDGDADGSGDTSGSEHSKKPNITATDTFATYGESASTQRVTESDNIFLGTKLWCQMSMKNTSSEDINDNFFSECYLSVGKKFDGWGDAISLDAKNPARKKGLDSQGTNTEHQGIDILFYPGWYNVVSKIDSGDDIEETDEKDNSFNKDHPFVFQIWGRPNIVASVVTDKQSYALGESISATASFSNTGSDPYGKTGYIDWYVDGAIIGREEDDRIKREHLHPSASPQIETRTLFFPQQYGTHELKVCFRFGKDDLVEEVSSEDNCAVTNVTIPNPNPQVIIEAPVPLEPQFDPNAPGGVLWQDKNDQTPLDLTCGPIPAEPDFSSPPHLQTGDVGATTIGKHRQRIFIPPENIPYVGSGFAGMPILDISGITQWCWSSDQTGWGIYHSKACGKPKPRMNGWWVVDIPKTPRASKGTWTIGYQTNETQVDEYWADAQLWTRTKVDTDNHIRYGGWKPNRMVLKTDASGYLALTAKFGTFGVSGFWVPHGESLTMQAFWHTDSDQDAGIPGTVKCDRATGKLVARVAGVTPNSTGRLVLGTASPYVYGWQSTEWILPTGASFNVDGNYTLPVESATKDFKIEITYDAGAERLTLTLPSKKLIPRAFWTAGNLANLTDKVVFQTWITSYRLIIGTLVEGTDGIITVTFEGVKSKEGGALYTVETDGKKSWQNIGNFAFGNGIQSYTDGVGGNWFVIP